MKIEAIIRGLIESIGLNPNDEYLKDTPRRVKKMWEILTSGYKMNIEELFSKSVCESKYDQMIVVKDIDFFSTCEHHLLPFYGKVHVGYLPDKKIIGLSKIPRLVEVFSRRLQVQERLTQQLAETLMDHLQPKGVGVIVEAQHLCMMMRGVEKVNSKIKTSVMLGAFKNDQKTRDEFLNLVNKNYEV